MSNDFKPGDELVAVESCYAGLNSSKIYEVVCTQNRCVKVTNDKGKVIYYDISNFRKYDPSTLDLTKPIRTRDGRDVTIITTEARG